MIEGKINWGEKDEDAPKEEVKPKTDRYSKSTIEQIEKLKKDISKDLANTVKNCDKLYELEKTNTLSSVQIVLTLLQREINKL